MRRVVKTADAERVAKTYQEALCKEAHRAGAFSTPWAGMSEAARRARVAAARDLLEREVIDVRPR